MQKEQWEKESPTWPSEDLNLFCPPLVSCRHTTHNVEHRFDPVLWPESENNFTLESIFFVQKSCVVMKEKMLQEVSVIQLKEKCKK